jgi:hypothetical protein
MTPLEIIRQASSEGLILSVSETGGIKLEGNRQAAEKWKPVIREHKAALIAALRDAGKAWRWRVVFADRDPVIVSFSPEASHSEVLEQYPDAVAAEPVPDTPADTGKPDSMTPEQEAAIRGWMARIGERDARTIDGIVDACRSDANARAYFLHRAANG